MWIVIFFIIACQLLASNVKATTEEEEPKTVPQLAPEILVHIFEFIDFEHLLNPVRLVSKEWEKFSQDTLSKRPIIVKKFKEGLFEHFAFHPSIQYKTLNLNNIEKVESNFSPIKIAKKLSIKASNWWGNSSSKTVERTPSSLTSLSASSSIYAQEILKNLSSLPNLTYFNFGGNPKLLGIRGLGQDRQSYTSRIAPLTDLKLLNLDYYTHEDMDEEDVKGLTGLTNLTNLSLVNDFTCNQVTQLTTLVNLQILNLTSNRLKDEDVLNLLPPLTNLTRLSLRANLISLKVLPTLQNLPHLTDLDIGGNTNLKQEDIEALNKALPHLIKPLTLQ